MDESVEGIAITVGETADREGQEDKNHPDSVIVHTLALKQLPCSTRVMVTLFFLYHNQFISSLSQNGRQQVISCQSLGMLPPTPTSTQKKKMRLLLLTRADHKSHVKDSRARLFILY